MEKLKIACFKWVAPALLLGMSLSINAQKLPNVQTVSLRAPANIKIDGKSTEWDNTFQAYNHATSCSYTMSNDDNNLYLIIHTDDPDELTKLTTVGITFNINTTGKKDDKDAISILYPYFEGNKKPFINFKSTPKIVAGSEASVAKADSFMNVSNKHLDFNSKFIKIKGIAGIDTLLSVYNDEGIKAREAFNILMAYTYELAIPLRYLNLSVKGADKIAYHILFHGISINDFGMVVTRDANGSFHVSVPDGAGGAIPSKEHLPAISSTTDFWGEYTLAKK